MLPEDLEAGAHIAVHWKVPMPTDDKGGFAFPGMPCVFKAKLGDSGEGILVQIDAKELIIPMENIQYITRDAMIAVPMRK